MKRIIIKLIEFYRRYISPGTLPTCRFSPTCSKYAIEAVEKYGAARGGLLAVKRFMKCHPWGGSGYDPVP